MNHAIRIVRPATLSSPLPSYFGKTTSDIKFRQVTTMSNQPKKPNTDKDQNPNEKTGNVMSHSFGEGYATRSDEEGFGTGTYSDNQTLQKDKEIHENHPAYDKTQGSEVKEKEKGRHQTNSSN